MRFEHVHVCGVCACTRVHACYEQVSKVGRQRGSGQLHVPSWLQNPWTLVPYSCPPLATGQTGRCREARPRVPVHQLPAARRDAAVLVPPQLRPRAAPALRTQDGLLHVGELDSGVCSAMGIAGGVRWCHHVCDCTCPVPTRLAATCRWVQQVGCLDRMGFCCWAPSFVRCQHAWNGIVFRWVMLVCASLLGLLFEGGVNRASACMRPC